MHKFFTEESPAKVLSLLGAALFSMFLLFGVSYGDASFAEVHNPLPNPFAPEKVVAFIDSAAAGYSHAAHAYFLDPLMANYQVYGDNIAWIWDESKTQIASAMGLENIPDVQTASTPQPRVAGAYTTTAYAAPQKSSSLIDTLYSFIIE